MNKEILKKMIIIGAIIIAIILVIFLTIFIMRKINHKDEPPKINMTKYSEKAIKVMKEENLYEKLKNKEYSKTIEVVLEDKLFNEKYLNEYHKINYHNINNFSETINSFLTKHYTGEEINYILKNLNEYINILLNMDHINILEYKDISNFNINKLERYINYQKENTKYDTKTVVTYVNIGLDLKGYSSYNTYTTDEAENNLSILVNKYHKLPDNYEPSDLTELSYKNGNYKYLLRKEAAEAFEKLTSAALLDNVIFYPFSAYRSFETQNILYSRYKNRDGEEKADTYSARPGFSEHQLGLAVDVRSNTLGDNLTNEHYKWMLENSYKYGFIVRYPKGKQHVTQFMEEPWHIRYIGVDLATKVHDSGLTYDEYYDLHISN